MAGNQPNKFYEAEIIEGLESFVIDELQVQDSHIKILAKHKGIVQFQSSLPPRKLLTLRTAIAIYAHLNFNVPRPKALLGHQYFHQILDTMQIALSLHPYDFKTLYIDAAGSDSSVMQRLKQELAKSLDLQASDTKGDMHLRIRRSLFDKQGWDVLIRLSPRPLATRNWRVANFQGALNGTVAHIMSKLSSPTPQDTILNIGTGSASLLIERAILGKSAILVGIDNDSFALDCATQNITAANLPTLIHLIHADARQLPFPSGTFNRIFADLPFGQLVGSHQDNVRLYPLILASAALVATDDALFMIITHEKTLMERILSNEQTSWRLVQHYPINLSGLHPQIYVLQKIA